MTPPTPARWLVVALLTGFALLGHFNRVSMSVAGNERFIGPDGLTPEQMGAVYSAFLLVYTIGMLPGGWLIDRVGPRLALTTMGLGMGLCVALTGVLGWAGLAVAALWGPLLVVRGVAGAFSVPLHPAAARSVAQWVPLAGRSTANGVVTAGALVGIAATYPVFGALMDQLGWPTAFAVCGAAQVLLAAVWFATTADAPAGVTPTPRATKGDVLALFGNRSLILLTLSYAGLGYFQYLFFYWIGYYFETELKLPTAESRAGAFTVTIAMAVGMACGGWVADRACAWLGRRAGCCAVAMSGMLLSALFGWLGITAGDRQLVVLYFSLALGSLGLCEGIFWTTAPVLGGRNGGLASALMNTGGNGAGLLAPVVTPWLAREYGWTAAIVVACAASAAGGLMWLGIRPPARSDDTPADDSRD